MGKYERQNSDSPLYIALIVISIVYTWADRWITFSDHYPVYVYAGSVFILLILWRFFYRMKKHRELCWAEVLFPLLIVIWMISSLGKYYGWL